MRRRHLITTRSSAITVTAVLLAAGISGVPAATQPGQAQGPPELSVPEGFEVQLVAGPPFVERPIVADFDERGRLYVADSSGSNDKTDVQVVERPHRIVRLTDDDGDGRFDRSTVFADKMMLPEGTMWLDGSLYVAAPPSIWKLTDTNDDGIADRREEWFQGKTLGNCANDLHGPYLGPDGWIYWTKGAFAEQTYERAGKAPLVTRASHIFRRRPGHTEIEPVMTGGMDNPVDVAFTPSGERILTATFLEHPQLGRRDAIIHAIYGGVYGKPHAVIEGHPRTGDLMPVMTHLGPAVPSGLTRYTSAAFGEAYRDNFFATMFNLRKVTRNVLEASGATFVNRESDFLVSSSRDFHPTDVIEDADGSLLVVDTGAWYKLCCPTSQLAKPDVRGAIYRVKRKGARTVSDPRGTKLAWSTMPVAQLAALLDDERTAVRSRSIEQLGMRGAAAVADASSLLRSSGSLTSRLNAVWALTRIDGEPARAAVRGALEDRDAVVRQAAVHSAGLWRDAAARESLTRLPGSADAALQRNAAEALGRLGDPGAIGELVTVAGTDDRVLRHSATYALIEIGDPSVTLAASKSARSPASQRAALMALDQIPGNGLTPDVILPLLESPEAASREAGWWIAGRHPSWSSALAPLFRRQLAAASTSAQREDLQAKLALFASDGTMQSLLAEWAGVESAASIRTTALGVMAVAARTTPKVLPSVWIGPLAQAIGDTNPDVAAKALSVVRAAPIAAAASPVLGEALLKVAGDTNRTLDARLDALSAVPREQAASSPDLFAILRLSQDAGQPALVRSLGAGIVERAALTREQLMEVTKWVGTAGPLELPRLLRAFDADGDEALGLTLVAALERATARASLRPDVLKPRLAKYPPAVQARADALLATVNLDAAAQARRLDELTAAVSGGDVRRGQQVFNSEKIGCLTCHAIGYAGGKIGPDLTRIGQVRNERDLLEAVVYPSASFVRSYEPVMVALKTGAVHTGVLKSEDRSDVVLTTSPTTELRLARSEIADIRPSPVSIMPAGYGDQLTRQELADLIAFLRAAR
jgi:putative membrane-bound dehydrogenase-like protein